MHAFPASPQCLLGIRLTPFANMMSKFFFDPSARGTRVLYALPSTRAKPYFLGTAIRRFFDLHDSEANEFRNRLRCRLLCDAHTAGELASGPRRGPTRFNEMLNDITVLILISGKPFRLQAPRTSSLIRWPRNCPR